jgi:hypothetical protein
MPNYPTIQQQHRHLRALQVVPAQAAQPDVLARVPVVVPAQQAVQAQPDGVVTVRVALAVRVATAVAVAVVATVVPEVMVGTEARAAAAVAAAKHPGFPNAIPMATLVGTFSAAPVSPETPAEFLAAALPDARQPEVPQVVLAEQVHQVQQEI